MKNILSIIYLITLVIFSQNATTKGKVRMLDTNEAKDVISFGNVCNA